MLNGGSGGLVPRRRLAADEPSPPSVFLDVPDMPREDAEFPGVRVTMLHDDPAGGICAMPMRLEPGAEVPLHEHAAIEQTWVLEGRFLGEEGERGRGQFA
jgi:anti-sigma factor ChrR (cupin superfamily)